MCLGRRDQRALSAVLVVELDLPAPLFSIVGIPPALENAGLPARQDDHPSQIALGGPAVLEGDDGAAAYQEAHRPRLMPLQLFAARDRLTRLIADRHLPHLGRRLAPQSSTAVA